MSKIGTNGFGRIGRLVLRRLLEVKNNVEVVVISDLASPKVLAYLLKHDSNYGPLPWNIDSTEDVLTANGKKIAVYAKREVKNIPWETTGAKIIVECIGFYASTEKTNTRLGAGAKKVLVSASTGDMKTIASNIDDGTMNVNDRIISVAPCTTNCLVPTAKMSHDSLGIQLDIMTIIRAYMGTQSLADGSYGKDLRVSRAAAESTIPHTTGVARVIGLVIPALSEKLEGHTQHIPVGTGSITELVSILGRRVTTEEVDNALKRAMQNNESLGYTDEEIVLSDVTGSHFGSVFDMTQAEITEAGGLQLAKTVVWYDNEYGFVTQLICTLDRFVKFQCFGGGLPPPSFISREFDTL